MHPAVQCSSYIIPRHGRQSKSDRGGDTSSDRAAPGYFVRGANGARHAGEGGGGCLRGCAPSEVEYFFLN